MKNWVVSFRKTLSLDKIIIAVFILLILFAALSGRESKYSIVLDSFIKVLFLQFFLFIPGFYFLKLLSKRYFNNHIAILLSCSVSILLFGSIFIVLKILNSPPFVYSLVNGGFAATLIALAYKKRLLGEIFKVDNVYKYGLLLILIGATMAICFVSVNTTIPKYDISGWTKIAERGLSPSLPADNELQYRTAEVFIKNLPPWTSGVWTMGDRPPLMGVINSIWILSTFNNKVYFYWHYEIIGIVLNILFILPCSVISKRIFKEPKVFYTVPLAVLLNVFIFVNIYYTWPKLMGIYFILVSIVLFLYKKIGYLTMSIAGILWGLASLAHGGAILSLPVLFLLCMIFLIKLKKLKYVIPFIVFFILLQSPWRIYKKVHPDINTDRLIYHYIPTIYFPDKPVITVSNLKIVINDFLEDYPMRRQLARRLDGLKGLIDKNRISTAINSLLTGNLIMYYSDLYYHEFFHPIISFGEFQILLCIPILLYFIIAYFLLKQKELLSNYNIQLFLFFLSFVILSYLFNAFIKWEQPNTNHALPYTELVFGIMIVSGISFSLIKTIRILSFSFIVFRFVHYVISSSVYHRYSIFDFFNLAVILGVVALICLSRYYQRMSPGSINLRKRS